MFSPVGRYEPRRPSGARISTIVGTRASAPIRPAEREQQVADERSRDDRTKRLGQREREPEVARRQDEERARDDHEQRDGQVRPEQEAVEDAEHAQPLGYGLDAPAGVVSSLGSLRRHDPDQVRRV